jgi:nucleoside-diphosphate-sugar epimerase
MRAPDTFFITGATGYIGGSVAESLVKRGSRVRGLVRNSANAELLSKRGIEPVMGDLNDTDLLIREARNAEGVINAASADHPESVRALIAGLKDSAKPLIHTSGASIVGDNACGRWASDVVYDEDTPLLVQPFKQPRRDIDLMVLSAAASGIRSIVICPSLIYGQGRGLNTKSVQIPFLVENARNCGAVQIVGAGHNIWSNVHIEDVVDMYLLALAKAGAGSFLFAANGEASFLEIGTAIAKRLNIPMIESLDAEIATSRWGVAKAHYSLGSNSRVRSAQARQKLGWAPRHASVIDWILKEMPIAPDSTQN